MNTQKSVFKKLSAIEKVEDKVELSEVQKVEFAVVDDFNKSVDRLKNGKSSVEKAAQEMLDDIQQFQKLQMKLKASFRKADSFAEQAEDEIANNEKVVDDIFTAINRMGFTVNDMKSIRINESIKLRDDIKSVIDTIRANSNYAKDIINL